MDMRKIMDMMRGSAPLRLTEEEVRPTLGKTLREYIEAVEEDLVDMSQQEEDHTLGPEHIRSIEQHLEDYLGPYGGGAEVLSVEKAENGWTVYFAFETSQRFEAKERVTITGRPTNSGQFEDFQVLDEGLDEAPQAEE